MNSIFPAGDLTVDTDARCVFRDGLRIELSDLSFSVLLALVSSAPEPVSRETLARRVWKSDHVSAETIAQRVRILRRTLGDDPNAPRYVRTVRNRGYAFVGAVSKPATQCTGHNRIRTSRLMGMALVAAGLFAAVSWLSGLPGRQSVPTSDNFRITSQVDLMISRAQDLLNVQQAEQNRQGIDILERALAMDPENPRIAVTLSFALSTRATKFLAAEDDSARAEELARYGLRVDASDSSAWHALAYALDAQGRVDEAISAYEMAYSLDPDDVAAMSSAAYLFLIRGRIYEALVLETRAMNRDHVRYSLYADSQIALSLDLLDHPAAALWRKRAQLVGPDQVVVLAENAEAHLRNGTPRAIEMLLGRLENGKNVSPRLIRLMGRAAVAQGDVARARSLFEKAGKWADMELAALAAINGDLSAAKAEIDILEQAMLQGDSWPEMRIQAAELSALLGLHGDALEFVSRAIDLGWRDLELLRQSPYLGQIRESPEWSALERRIEQLLEIQSDLVTQSDVLQLVLSI